MAKGDGLTRVPNARVDIEKIHPSLRHLYGNGLPVRTYITEQGTTVRYFGTMLADTEEENTRRLGNAFYTAERIRDEIAAQKLQEECEAVLAVGGG